VSKVSRRRILKWVRKLTLPAYAWESTRRGIHVGTPQRGKYAELLHQDLELRRYLMKRLEQAGVSRIVIERPTKKSQDYYS
jgi:hypothetical protein